MKSTVRYLLPLLGLAVALRADEDPKPSDPKITEKTRKEVRVIVGSDAEKHGGQQPHVIVRRAGKPELESVTFLGVETNPVGETLAAQLGLATGTGLVVGNVVKDTPAATALKSHDVLVKLGDQILIDQHQLQVLVRSHKEGDEVALTFIRGGREQTVKVKLAKHDVPKFSGVFNEAFPSGPGMWEGHLGQLGQLQNLGRPEMDRVLSLIDGGGAPGVRTMNLTRAGHGDRRVSVTVDTGKSNMLFDDEKGSLELKITDGKKELVAKDPKGAELFSGPVNTPEERNALPADVRVRLEKLEGMHDFSFKTDGDFKGGEVRVLHPGGQKIAIPAMPAVRPIARPATPTF